MSEAAHAGEYSNAQGVRADGQSSRRSWFAKAGHWLLSLKWIDATKRITAIILTLGSTILIALILALIAQGVFANTPFTLSPCQKHWRKEGSPQKLLHSDYVMQ